MIEGLTNILRMAYFSKLEKKPEKKKQLSSYNRKRHSCKWELELTELCKCIESSEPIEHWILQF